MIMQYLEINKKQIISVLHLRKWIRHWRWQIKTSSFWHGCKAEYWFFFFTKYLIDETNDFEANKYKWCWMPYYTNIESSQKASSQHWIQFKPRTVIERWNRSINALSDLHADTSCSWYSLSVVACWLTSLWLLLVVGAGDGDDDVCLCCDVKRWRLPPIQLTADHPALDPAMFNMSLMN